MMISPQWALVSGISLSFFVSQHQNLQAKAKLWGTRLLQVSVILLGPSLNFHSVIKEGASGALLTFVSIAIVFLLGYVGMKIFRVEKKLGILITMGTAICGGSAIGALAPVIMAESLPLTISIAIVFLLNALSVFIFPALGSFFSLSQNQFGIWSALAIHDTSSVVAASTLFGQEALLVATTIKLTRALWIIPITLLAGMFWKHGKKNISLPWFVLGFLSLSLVFTFLTQDASLKNHLLFLSKTGFALTLFLIGLTFDMKKMKQVGMRPFIFGLVLWALVSTIGLLYVKITL